MRSRQSDAELRCSSSHNAPRCSPLSRLTSSSGSLPPSAMVAPVPRVHIFVFTSWKDHGVWAGDQSGLLLVQRGQVGQSGQLGLGAREEPTHSHTVGSSRAVSSAGNHALLLLPHSAQPSVEKPVHYRGPDCLLWPQNVRTH